MKQKIVAYEKMTEQSSKPRSSGSKAPERSRLDDLATAVGQIDFILDRKYKFYTSH